MSVSFLYVHHLCSARVVMLLTDGNGVDTPNDVYQLIQTQNAAMNNSLVFVTFGIAQCQWSFKL